MTTTVRVSEDTRARAAGLAAAEGASIGDILDRALTAYETAEFWRRTRVALEHAGSADLSEGWDRTLRDGLDDD